MSGYTRLNPRPTGYDSSAPVNLLNYSEDNPYTAPADGIVRLDTNYRQGAYTIVNIKTGAGAAVVIELSSPVNANAAGSQSMIAPVFKGQKLWAALNSSVQYGSASYMQYTY